MHGYIDGLPKPTPAVEITLAYPVSDCGIGYEYGAGAQHRSDELNAIFLRE